MNEVSQILQNKLNIIEKETSVEIKPSITTHHFEKLCRTCLMEGDHNYVFNIVCDGKTLSELLNQYAALEVQQGDRFPPNICSNCLEDVVRTYYFIRKCQQSDNALRCFINSKCKKESEEDNSELENIFEDQTPSPLKSEADSCNDDREFSPEATTKRKVAVRKKRSTRTSRSFKRVRGPPYACRDCKDSFKTQQDLKDHRDQVKHPEVRNYACSICGKMFTSSKLRQHMRSHTKEKPFKCEVCLQSFSMSGNLKRHMMTHTGERPHVCDTCGKGFIQATTLHNHKKTHSKNERLSGDTSSPNFICNCCGRGFKRLARYNVHLKKHFADTPECKKPALIDEPREHICTICKRAYKTKHLLKAHLLTHGEKTFLCSECGKGFVTKAALQSHLKVHTGEKPHTCNICKKSFAHVGSFEAHMLIHTGQKPYSCNICTKAFTQLSHLKYHLRTHSGERPYMCSYCGKSFALKGNLTVHVRTHTGETPFICSVCGKGFYDSSSLKKHKRAHGVFTCPPAQSVSVITPVSNPETSIVNDIHYIPVTSDSLSF